MRPIKQGLDYFPLDVDMDTDDKIVLIESRYGSEGFSVIIKLFMKIYRNGYYYKWTERELLLFSKKINVNEKIVNDIVNDCIQWEIFNEKLFEKYKILTSEGIQKRYFEAIKRRRKIDVCKEYVVIPINEYINKDNVVIYSINTNISTQRKGEEIKEKNKSNNINEYINKNKEEYNTNSIEIKFSKYLYKKIKENNPKHKKPNFQTWAKDIDLMLRIDKRDKYEIKKIIDWCQTDDFWKGNILSAKKLRAQYDQLLIKSKINKKVVSNGKKLKVVK